MRIGATTVVTSGESTGFAILGPDPSAGTTAGKVTCSPASGGTDCTNLFTSANDAGSTCTIEVNGPVRAIVKCTFDHENGGNVYMHGTARYYFTKGRSDVKVVANLRNADKGAANSFANAHKAHRGWELRLTPAISGTLDYAIAKHSGNETGTVAAADAVRIYASQSTRMKVSTLTYCTGFAGCVPYTDDQGYEIVKTVSGTPSTLATGDKTQHPIGWADIANSSGVGVTFGAYEMAAHHMKSLEWNNGQVRVGLWTPYNTWDSTYPAYYQRWPEHSIQEAWLNFHTSAPSSPQNDFLRYQHSLVGRASVAHYNDTGVFPFGIPTASQEDAWYTATDAAANPAITGTGCCVKEKGLDASEGWTLRVYPWFDWATGGADRQAEHRLSDLVTFLKRGMPGRYRNAMHFYRFQSSFGNPRSDGFDWRTEPAGDKDGQGRPNLASINSDKASAGDWSDQEHRHTYGLPYAYFMSGDEVLKDGVVETLIDLYAHDNAGTLWNSRANGGYLLGAGITAEFLRDIGDSANQATVLARAVSNFNAAAKNDLCLNGYPSGCSGSSNGISRVRGARWGYSGEIWLNGQNWCGVPLVGNKRGVASFQSAIFVDGLLSLRRAKGPDWADYTLAGDLAYGMAKWFLGEMFEDNGNGRWDQNGSHYYLLIDKGNSECIGITDPQGYHIIGGRQTTHQNWLPFYQTEGSIASKESKIKLAWQGIFSGYGTQAADYGGYTTGDLIYKLANPGRPSRM